MTKEEIHLARRNMDSIREYRIVLSKMVKHPVSLEQAMADWIERRYYGETAIHRSFIK